MSHSTHVGFSCPVGVPSEAAEARVDTPPHRSPLVLGVGCHRPVLAIVSSDGRTAAPGDGDWLLPSLLADGVGNDEDAIAEVRGTNGGSRDAFPLRIEPELGQISENSSKPERKVAWNVLQQRESWS